VEGIASLRGIDKVFVLASAVCPRSSKRSWTTADTFAGGGFDPMLAHEDWHVATYLDALDGVFSEMAAAMAEANVAARIGGALKQKGFDRLI
jgi:hypothetical protein